MTLKYFESICSACQLEADKTCVDTMRVVTLLIVWNEKVPLLRHSLIWMVKATTHWSDFTDWKFVVISCYRFKSLITMYFAFILEHFMWCFSPPSNFIHCFMRWYRWMAWRGLPTTNSFTRHSVSWAHLPNLLPCATACDPFKRKNFKMKTWDPKGSVWIVYQDITQVSQRAGSGFKQRSSLSHLCSWEDLPLPSAALHRAFLLKYLVFAKTNNDQRKLIASTIIFFWI